MTFTQNPGLPGTAPQQAPAPSPEQRLVDSKWPTTGLQWNARQPGAAPAAPAAPTTGTVTIGGGTGDVASDLANADTAAVGTDAQALISAVLGDYGLQSLGTWAWDEITSGATSAQMLLDMQQTPQFKTRFPGIAMRQQKGLPAISPADYVNYEDSLAQMQSQYGLPQGFLTNANTVAEFIGNDVSANEVQARVQQGYQAVAYAPTEVRAFYAQTFGAAGDGALAAHFLDESKALPLLEQQATAATLGGTAAMGGIQISGQDAMKLAQLGVTQNAVQSQTANLEQTQDLYQASVTEQPGMTAGQQGIEAAFGLNSQSTMDVAQRQAQRQADFKGGGSPTSDQYGLEGAGPAKTA